MLDLSYLSKKAASQGRESKQIPIVERKQDSSDVIELDTSLLHPSYLDNLRWLVMDLGISIEKTESKRTMKQAAKYVAAFCMLSMLVSMVKDGDFNVFPEVLILIGSLRVLFLHKDSIFGSLSSPEKALVRTYTESHDLLPNLSNSTTMKAILKVLYNHYLVDSLRAESDKFVCDSHELLCRAYSFSSPWNKQKIMPKLTLTESKKQWIQAAPAPLEQKNRVLVAHVLAKSGLDTESNLRQLGQSQDLESRARIIQLLDSQGILNQENLTRLFLYQGDISHIENALQHIQYERNGATIGFPAQLKKREQALVALTEKNYDSARRFRYVAMCLFSRYAENIKRTHSVNHFEPRLLVTVCAFGFVGPIKLSDGVAKKIREKRRRFW